MTPVLRYEETFIARMRSIRESRGLSQEALANALRRRGMAFHQQAIARIERGVRKVSLGEAYAIAEELHTDLPSMTGSTYWPSSAHLARIAELEQAVASAQRALASVESATDLRDGKVHR